MGTLRKVNKKKETGKNPVDEQSAFSTAPVTSRQIGNRLVKFSRQIIFSLAMATKTVAAWSTANSHRFIAKAVNFSLKNIVQFA